MRHAEEVLALQPSPLFSNFLPWVAQGAPLEVAFLSFPIEIVDWPELQVSHVLKTDSGR